MFEPSIEKSSRLSVFLVDHFAFLLGSLVLATLLFAPEVSTSSALAAESQTPNIVLIVADDLGYRELGCYGQKWIKTPNIDRIAAEGIRFTQFYSGNAVCAPARCNLMTGKHPGHAWVRSNGNPNLPEAMWKEHGWEYPGQHPLPASEVTIAEMLKQKDYATGAMGKWGLGQFGTSGDPNRQGFDLFYGYNCQRHAHNHYPKFLWRNDTKVPQPGNDRTLTGETYSQDQFTRVALEFIEENQDRPFFLYLPFAIPHLSIQVPEDSLAEYRDVIPEEEYKHRGYLEHPFPRAGYAAMISHMDRDVGKILARLEQLDLEENTLVLFTSDNGPTYDRLGGSDSEFFESAGELRGLKGSLYEGGIRVPLVARWPGEIEPGRETDLISAYWDLMPTFAEATGTEPPDNIDGLSLLPTMRGQAGRQENHEFLYWEFPSYGGQQALRMGPWKGVRQNLLGKNPQKTIELYNLEQDPGETRDVAEEHPRIVNRIARLFEREHTDSEIFPIPALDESP